MIITDYLYCLRNILSPRVRGSCDDQSGELFLGINQTGYQQNRKGIIMITYERLIKDLTHD